MHLHRVDARCHPIKALEGQVFQFHVAGVGVKSLVLLLNVSDVDRALKLPLPTSRWESF
jgi:hypothetical protein